LSRTLKNALEKIAMSCAAKNVSPIIGNLKLLSNVPLVCRLLRTISKEA